MYAELRITAEYGNVQAFVQKLRQEIGVNLVTAEAAIGNTVLKPYAGALSAKAVAAEQIQHKAFILYFLEGSDTIVAYVLGRTLAETKQQAVRIARRTCALFGNPAVKNKAKAVIYAVTSQGSDTAIISGNRSSRWRRFVDAFTERWLARIVTPGIVFGMAATYLPSTNFVLSALIGFLAAVVALLIESIALASTLNDWKWEDIKNDD